MLSNRRRLVLEVLIGNECESAEVPLPEYQNGSRVSEQLELLLMRYHVILYLLVNAQELKDLCGVYNDVSCLVYMAYRAFFEVFGEHVAMLRNRIAAHT